MKDDFGVLIAIKLVESMLNFITFCTFHISSYVFIHVSLFTILGRKIDEFKAEAWGIIRWFSFGSSSKFLLSDLFMI